MLDIYEINGLITFKKGEEEIVTYPKRLYRKYTVSADKVEVVMGADIIQSSLEGLVVSGASISGATDANTKLSIIFGEESGVGE